MKLKNLLQQKLLNRVNTMVIGNYGKPLDKSSNLLPLDFQHGQKIKEDCNMPTQDDLATTFLKRQLVCSLIMIVECNVFIGGSKE